MSSSLIHIIWAAEKLEVVGDLDIIQFNSPVPQMRKLGAKQKCAQSALVHPYGIQLWIGRPQCPESQDLAHGRGILLKRNIMQTIDATFRYLLKNLK